MTTIVILDMRTTPEAHAATLAAISDALEDTRRYPGCEGLELIANQDEPGNLAVIERWATRADYESYFAWRQETGFSAEFRAMLAEPPTVRKFDISRDY